MTNGMQVLEIWQERFGHPEGSMLGFFGASSAIGGIIPFIFFSWISDAFGRRWPTAIGSVVIIVGVIVEFFATSLNMYIGGKIVVGIGSSFIQMGAPVLVTELSHPKERVAVTTFYNTSIVLGYVIGAWATFGCYRIPSQWAWRLPTLVQVVPSTYQFCLIWFCPESPRWLIAHDRMDEARAILVKFHGECDPHSELVAFECAEIQDAITTEKENNMTWRDFFSSRSNLKRIALCFATALFSQTAGNSLLSNYLTQILKDTGLKTQFEITLVNGMVTLWQYIVAIFVTVTINRWGRRTFFLTGSGGSLVVFVAWTIASQQYIEHGSIVGGRIVLACIFLFQAFYTLAWTNLIVTYPLEIVTYQMRAKTWSFVLLIIQVSSIFSGYVNPIGLENISWRFYIYYCVWVAIIFLVVYFFFVETAGPTLEELTYIFEGKPIKEKMTEHWLEKKQIMDIEGDEKSRAVHVDSGAV
jgi:sugar porter (SP) family MFS transporter